MNHASGSHLGPRDSDELTPLLELQLVEAYRDGDPDAMERLLRGYQGRVYAVCYRMIRNPEIASDLAQDSMLRVIQNLSSYDGRAKLSTWIIRVTMNCCFSHMRKQKLRNHSSLDAIEESIGQMQRSGEPQPDDRIQQRQQSESVQSAFQALDPDNRALLVLRDLQGLDYQQIGEVFEIPVGTVKSRLFRARAALREAVQMEQDQQD